MNLERCIERDMARFLDSAVHVAEKPVVPRQEDAAAIYSSQFQDDIRSHLRRADIEGAKKVFNHLKERYNSTPEEHTEERKNLYELVQACYIEIVNYLQEREKTSELLQRMEQAPSDVFDTRVRPVNLQVVDRAEKVNAVRDVHGAATTPNIVVVQMPAVSPSIYQPQPVYQYSTRATPMAMPESAQKTIPQPLPAPIIITAPPPAVQMPAVAQPPAQAPVSMPTVVLSSNVDAERERERREHQIHSAVQATLKRLAELGKTDPTQALAELKDLGETIIREKSELHVSPLNAKELLGEVEQLERTLQHRKDEHLFDRAFQNSYMQLVALARSKQASAVSMYQSIRSKVDEYEKENPGAQNNYSGRLEALRRNFALYSEEDVIQIVTPIITRLKVAQQTQSLVAFEQAYSELDRFTRTLPHTQERAMLESTINSLRARRSMLQQTHATKPLTIENHG